MTSWPTIRLKFLATEPMKYGANQEASDTDPEQPRFVRITDISDDGGLRPDTFRSLPIEAAQGYMLQAGDVLFARSGATVGKTFRYDASWGQACFAGYLIRFRCDKTKLMPEFLRYFAQSVPYWDQISASTIQATIQNFSAEKYGDLTLIVPPTPAQLKLVSFLNDEIGRIDHLIHEKERMLELLAEKRAALVTQAVTRGLDPKVRLTKADLGWSSHAPEHWQVMQLKRTWSSSEYGISDSIREEGDIRVLRMSCITKDGRIDLANSGQVEEVPPGLLLTEGDVLFNRTNSLDQIAKVGLLDIEPETPTSFASYLVRIRVNSRVSQGYLVALLNSRDFL